MASVPIKFRCYRCHQLIGVSRSKAGAVVTCPKCQVDIVVPEPEDEVGRSSATSSTVSTDGGISLDILDFRPEDIRAEPGSDHGLFPSPTAALTSPVVELALSVPPEIVPTPVETPWPIADAPLQVARTMNPLPAQASHPPMAPARTVIPTTLPNNVPVMPAIEIDDSPTISRSQRIIPQVRSRDLVLPRSVVASWSLFVILALALSFTAGLFAGHYVWRVH